MRRRNSKPKHSLSKVSLLLCSTLACFPLQHAQAEDTASLVSIENQEEAFLVRRIAEFWKDQDYELVKQQITEFIAEHPNSSINDQLRGVLADLYLQESLYEKALTTYELVTQKDIIEKIIINKLQCYYELNQFDAIAEQGKPFLVSTANDIVDRKNELNFLIAESLFRKALKEQESEQQKLLATQARDLYETLLDSPFKEHSEFALAEIYTIVGEYNLSASLYEKLATANEVKKEELLFHAATSQAHYDKDLAIKTFTEVMEINGTKKNEAAYNRLVLFFQENAFEEVLNHYHNFTVSISDDKKPTLEYIIGRSYFALDQFESAKKHLGSYLNYEGQEQAHYKNALLMLLTCAQKLNNDELFDETIAQLKSHFNEANELKQALFIHAMMLKAQGKTTEAQEELEQILKNHPDYEDKESLYLEYGLITHDNEHWQISYTTLKNFINSYPNAAQAHIAWKYFLSSSLNYLKSIEEGQYSYSQQEFYNDLSAVMKKQADAGNILNASEEKECKLLSAKTAYELGKYDNALEQLNAYLETYENDASIGEAHFLVGLCHQKLGADPALFYEHAEKAVGLNEELNHSSSVHLQLYNSYLSKADMLGKDSSETAALYEKAAEHLYVAIEKGNYEIKLQNRLWLANQYYTMVKEGALAQDSTEYVRARSLFETALVQPESQTLISIKSDSLFLESEILKFSELLSDDTTYKINILKDLVSQQHQNNSMEWKLQKQALLELAKSYELAQQEDAALETYLFITEHFDTQSSYTVDYAKLHQARLQFKLLGAQLEKNPDKINMILSHLKDLQIKRTVASEPLHLEASIDYAKLRAKTASAGEQENRYLFFLNRIKEDYLSETDTLAVEYQKQLAENQKVKGLFDLHMQYVDAEILRTKAKLEHNDNKLSSAEELNSQALSKLSDIKTQPGATLYLKDQVDLSIYEIDNINSY